jgi:N-acyl homoserine lactone hydrolase
MKGIKVYILRNGIITDMPKEMLISTGAPVDPEDVVRLPVQSYLIDHPEGYLMYDTGHSREERYFTPTEEKDRPAWRVPEEDELPNQLKRLGVAFEDVKYVICSHLHIDHTGYLEYFTNSEIIASDAEFSHMAKMHALGKLDYPFVNADFEEWLRVGLNWRLIEPDVQEFQLLEGIKVFNFGPGHSYGMLGVLVELEKTGNIIIISDAVYCSENMGPPIRLPGFIVDNEGYIQTAERIMRLAERYNAEIWYGHDMKQFEGMVLMDEGYYT